MARELRWWLAGAFVACAVLAVGYLSPRGAAPAATAQSRQREPTAPRLRARRLAERWRAADLAVRLAVYRRRLEPELARRRETDQPGPALLVEAPDTVPAFTKALVAPALDTVWRELGLGVSKVAVGVVVDFWRIPRTGTDSTPKVPAGSVGYLLPDSIDRATCIALIPAWFWMRGRTRQLEDWLRRGLGPCAFFARWGVPGKPVRLWMARRHYDLASVPSWGPQRSEPPEASWMMNRNTGWFWAAVYGHPIAAIGCLAGRAPSCRTAVLAGAGDAFADSLPRLLDATVQWWREERLVQGRQYLGDVAREVGYDRFLRFWNSTEPVDTALAAALRMPVGKWTARWQRRFLPRLPLGAAAPLSAAVLGILLGGAAVALVARGAMRRQVG
ncbi:MAG TPA: hypothetical protein VIV88_13870 [Gemmatimonadales bacterium]|jgi:hypothetical protein